MERDKGLNRVPGVSDQATRRGSQSEHGEISVHRDSGRSQQPEQEPDRASSSGFRNQLAPKRGGSDNTMLGLGDLVGIGQHTREPSLEVRNHDGANGPPGLLGQVPH
eukprot:15009326-Alexandrium_andersonii.AAC.1